MTIFVVTGERAFYNDTVHLNIPETAKPLPHATYEALLQAQTECRQLDFDVYPPAIKDRHNEVFEVHALQALIDDRAAQVYAVWSRFEKETEAREAAARSYRDNEFQGEASVWITSYADSAGLNYIDAALSILKHAQQRHAAQEALAVLRMRKYELTSLEGEHCYQQYRRLMEDIDKISVTPSL